MRCDGLAGAKVVAEPRRTVIRLEKGDKDLERVRRESPAYTGDEGWEELPPPMAAVLSVRFDLATMRRLAQVARATDRTPSGIIRDWTIERLSTVGSGLESEPVHAIRESVAAYSSTDDELRASFRPDRVRWLFVGESSPASGRFFYRANSNLFFAVRQAFENALGPVPGGVGFLDEFKRHGAWLVDMVDRSINRTRGRPRADAVDAGIDQLVATMAEARPDLVIAVKATLEGPVRRAAQTAGIPPDAIHVLPFPVRQWRVPFVRELSAALRVAAATGRRGSPSRQEGITLHGAMAEILQETGPAPARMVANEINVRDLYRRGDGRSIDYQQVLARARRYPDLFRITRDGVELA